MGAARIRALNDAFRTTLTGGRVLISRGVATRGEAFIAKALEAVRGFDGFDPDNDPHEEHDFDAVTINGDRLFFKIDCYDPTGTAHSEDPADPEETLRVMTIMLAEEY